MNNDISPHILERIENGGNSIYVLEGEDGGWHDFTNPFATVDYMKKLTAENIDFILNPNW